MDAGYVSPFDLDNAWMGGKVKAAPASALPPPAGVPADESASLAPGDSFCVTLQPHKVKPHQGLDGWNICDNSLMFWQ